MLSREAAFLEVALCLLSLLAVPTATAQSHWSPCGRPLFSSFNYPVIVYDAQTRTAVLAYKKSVTDLIEKYKSQRTPIAANEIQALNPDRNSPSFLCYGTAVDIYI